MEAVKKYNRNVAVMAFFIGLIVVMGASLLISQSEYGAATQGEFAVKLVEALGVKSLLAEGASVNECVALLEDLGITPPGGFQADKPLERRDVAVLMVKAKSHEGELVDTIQPSTKKGFVEIEKASIMKFKGEVSFRKGPQRDWKPIRSGMELVEGDAVKTAEGSFVDLRIGTFGAVRIQESTEIVLRELTKSVDQKSGNVVIFITGGEVLSKTISLPKGSLYTTISTTTAVAVRGTIPNHRVTPDGDVITSAESTVVAWLVDALGQPVGDEIMIGEGKAVSSSPGGFGPIEDADDGFLAGMRQGARELMDEVKTVERHWAWLKLQNWNRDNVNAAERLLKRKGIDISSTSSALQSVSPEDGEKKMMGTDQLPDKKDEDDDTDLPGVTGKQRVSDKDPSKKPPLVQEPPGATKYSVGGGSKSTP